MREDFSVDIAKLDEDFDELVIPDLDEEKLKLFIRSVEYISNCNKRVCD